MITLYLFQINYIIVLGNCPDGRIDGGRCFVSTVFYISTYNGSLYFLAHSIGTPSNMFVLELRFTFSPSETFIGLPFDSRSISVWFKVLGSMYVLCSCLLNKIINGTRCNFPYGLFIYRLQFNFYFIINFRIVHCFTVLIHKICSQFIIIF